MDSIKYFFLNSKVNGVLELDKKPEGTARYCAVDKWTNQLTHLQKKIANKMSWFGLPVGHNPINVATEWINHEASSIKPKLYEITNRNLGHMVQVA